MSDSNAIFLVKDALGFVTEPERSREFLSTLTLGQIIEGRVLRQVSKDRYRINFSGNEKIVDSAIPLRTDDVLFGKVIGLGDQIMLKPVRLVRSSGGESSQISDAIKTEAAASAQDGFVATLSDNFFLDRVSLNSEERYLLESLLREADVRTSILRAVLISHKFALKPLNERLLLLISHVLNDSNHRLALSIHAVNISTANAGKSYEESISKNNPTFINVFAESLQQLIAASIDEWRNRLSKHFDVTFLPKNSEVDVDKLAGTSFETSKNLLLEDEFWESVAAVGQLLNAQTGGALTHRFCTVPFVIDGELVEVDIALFDHECQSGDSQIAGPQMRRVVFNLRLPRLGALQIDINFVVNRINAEILTESDEICEQLALHASTLRKALTAFGWQVDGLTYKIGNPEKPNGALLSVVEHLIASDSVNRSM